MFVGQVRGKTSSSSYKLVWICGSVGVHVGKNGTTSDSSEET